MTFTVKEPEAKVDGGHWHPGILALMETVFLRYENMIEERRTKTRHVIESSYGVFGTFPPGFEEWQDIS